MRFNFDIPEPSSKGALTPPSQSRSLTPPSQSQSRSPSSATPANEEVEWVPLQNHPIFSNATATHSSNDIPKKRNLMAWDGASRLYYWDINTQSLHRISLRFGEPEPTSVLAASPTKVFLPLNKTHSQISGFTVLTILYHILLFSFIGTTLL